MRSAYKTNKIDKNGLTPCAKCDCLILSDSSDPNNETCIRIKKTGKEKNLCPNYSSGDADETISMNDGIVINPKPNSTVKIIVSQPTDDETSTDKSTSTDNQTSPPGSENSKKHICFRFCSKKKKLKNAEKDQKKEPKQERLPERVQKQGKSDHLDGGNQTSKLAVSTAKTQSSNIDLAEIIKTCTYAKGSGSPPQGGVNTNTIIFQKDQASGDGMASLETWLKIEAKANSRNLDDILNEVHRQRREILDVKDTLDTIVRTLREQMYMAAYGKSKNQLLDDYNRKQKFCDCPTLERKTNSLSIKKSGEDDKKSPTSEITAIEKVPAAAPAPVPAPDLPPPPQPPEEKKKKKFFTWCK